MERTTKGEGLATEELRMEVEQLRAEDERRSQRALRLGIVFSTTLIAVAVAAYTFLQQGPIQAEFESLIQKEIVLQSSELRARAEETKIIAAQVMDELKRQRERLASLSGTFEGSISENVELRLTTLASQVASLESELAKIQSANVVGKLEVIEKSLEGDVTKLLSVPLLKTKFDSFRSVTEKESLKLEKNIERLESRINFFVTTTVTLLLGIITAVLAPLFISLFQRRATQRSDAGSIPDKQNQPSP